MSDSTSGYQLCLVTEGHTVLHVHSLTPLKTFSHFLLINVEKHPLALYNHKVGASNPSTWVPHGVPVGLLVFPVAKCPTMSFLQCINAASHLHLCLAGRLQTILQLYTLIRSYCEKKWGTFSWCWRHSSLSDFMMETGTEQLWF